MEVKERHKIDEELVDKWSAYFRDKDGFKLMAEFLHQILCVQIDTREIMMGIRNDLKEVLHETDNP